MKLNILIPAAGLVLLAAMALVVIPQARPSETTADWRDMPLVDVRSGDTFTLADFEGQTVYVQAMATWCTTCRRQMTILRDAIAGFEGEGFAVIGLSVETHLRGTDLAQYVDAHGFHWTFAVKTPELLRELTNTFGRAINTPPATPHFIIRPDGSFTELSTGIKSAEEIIDALRKAAAL